MQKNTWVIFLLITIDILLICICGFFYIKKDRVEPRMAFTADNTVYTPDMDTSLLTAGMTATDNKDGDMTDRIVIEKILENKEGFFSLYDKKSFTNSTCLYSIPSSIKS